jgi:3'(2'), 5'-bisphosphate nucleotidase
MTTAADSETLPVIGLSHAELARRLLPAVMAASAVALHHFRAGCAVERKADGSPVTAADAAVETMLTAALASAAPGLAVVAEEAVAAGRTPGHTDTFFLVDPLDGTREFVDGSGEFTLNIALVHAGVPVFGLVAAPVLEEIFLTTGPRTAVALPWAGARTAADLHTPLQTRAPPPAGLTALVSRSHATSDTDRLLAGLKIAGRIGVGSSLKFCRLAAGQADVYPRGGPTSEWDTAAGDAILRAAGGRVVDLAGAALRYGKRHFGYRNPPFIAWGR